MYRTAFNTSNAPLAVSESGLTIGSREWGAVETTDAVTKRLLPPDGTGALVLVEEPEGGIAPDHPAAAAFARTRELAARQEAAQAAPKEALVEAAVEAGLLEDGEDPPNKPELVEAIVEDPSVQVPSKRRSRQTQED